MVTPLVPSQLVLCKTCLGQGLTLGPEAKHLVRVSGVIYVH